MCLKRVEKESYFKSFILFFSSMAVLVGALFFLNYEKERQTLDEKIFSQMRVCSYTLVCEEFDIDFVPKQNYEPYKLYKNTQELSAYFAIPGSEKNYLKLYMPYKKYLQDLQALQNKLLLLFVFVLFVIALLSLGFAYYTLAPLRNALVLTEEFIKDILHDFNTPLATLRLNIASLKKQLGDNKKIRRIEDAVQNILNLQENLKAYLKSHAAQKEDFELQQVLQERIELLKGAYKTIDFEVQVPNTQLHCNKDAFVRILDNILSNAAKYNKAEGYVRVVLQNNILSIQDSGKGIHNPSRIFERFYKEQERGIGIGLHIVQKLCEELSITIRVESEVDVGTVFYLDIKSLVL